MPRWKGQRFQNFSSVPSQRTPTEEYECLEDNAESSSPREYLLSPKGSPTTSSEGSVLPTFQTHDSFLMMTCKRTVFACRGLFLFLLIIILIISVVVCNNGVPTPGSESGSADGDFRLIELPLPSRSLASNSTRNVTQVYFNAKCGYRKSDYSAITNSLRKALEFYEKNVDKITVLDGALGAKIAGEQLRLIRRNHPLLPIEISDFIHELAEKAIIVSDVITETVKRSTNDSVDLIYTLPWVTTPELWELPQNNVWHKVGELEYFDPSEEEDSSGEVRGRLASKRENINEQTSDACIYQVFHCDTANITDVCRSNFLDQESSLYSLTHQVIYVLLAQKNKCADYGSWKNVPTLHDGGKTFLRNLCGKVWQEANSIDEEYFPPQRRDLFIEQIGMCGLAGYTDFFQRDWLRRIISWQSGSTSGCYVERRRRIPPASLTMGQLLNKYRKRTSAMQDPFNYFKEGFQRMRRSDVFLKDDGGKEKEKCSVHFTSVAIAALSVHLHYFADTCLSKY